MKSFLIISFIFLFAATYADSIPDIKAVPIEQPMIEQPLSDSKSAEIYYRMLYENSKANYDKLTTLMWVAFGIIVGFIIAMVAGAWYLVYLFNSKKYEKLKDGFDQQIQNSYKNLQEDSKKVIDKHIDKSEQSIEKKFDEINNKYSTNYQATKSGFEDIINSLKSEMVSESSLYKEKIAEFLKLLDSTSKKLDEKFTLKVGALESDINNLHGQSYLDKQWFGVAISYFALETKNLIEIGNLWALEYSLKRLIESIDGVLETDDDINKATIDDIEFILSKIPKKLIEKKINIESKYKKMKIRKNKS